MAGRVSPTERARAEIDELFASDQLLGCHPRLAWMYAAITAGTIVLLLAFLASSRRGAGQPDR